MKSLKLYFGFLFFLIYGLGFSQVQIDRQIQLTGSGTDAKINGIRSVTDSLDATSVNSIQKGRLIYAMAGGSLDSFILNLTPAISAYDTGMVFNFISNQNVTGAATLNINNQGAKAIKKNINQTLSSCDIQSGQFVTVAYDGANFQMISVSVPLIPTTASAGPNQSIAGTSATLAANTPVVGAGLWTIASGSGGGFSNAASPSATFTGLAGNTYILNWTISVCGSASTSADTITLRPVPATISGLTLWYDANDASSITYSSGTAVSVWADKSGNGFNASNATTSEQPVLVANDINGHPALRFTSTTDDYLANAVFTMNLANRSVFVVIKENDPNVCTDGILSIRGSFNDYDSNDGYEVQNDVNGKVQFDNTGSYKFDIATSGSLSCQLPLGIYTDIASGGAGTGYVNGVPGGTGNNPSATTSLGGLSIGARYLGGATPTLGSYQLDGDYAELIIYNRALTTTERDAVGAYLSAKWGVSFAP